MPLGNFTRRSTGARKPTDPRELFEGLTLRGDVQNLWTPQNDALVEWHGARSEPDVTIEMPTGGGKTLVGLIVAQSIVNEGKGRVLYVCPTNQLVEQTADKARELGITVGTYFEQEWTNKDAYMAGTAPCITNYAAAFHGHSSMGRDGLEAIIVDDAHVAVSELKSRFTLDIDDEHPAFKQLKTALNVYAASLGKGGRFDEAIGGAPHALCFLPTFTTSRNALALQHLLLKHGVKDEKSTKYVWPYMADRLDRCLFLIGSGRIQISAPLPSISSVAALSTPTRRVYLTATLPSPYDAARVFGQRIAARVIRPQGKLGAAQKMIGFLFGDNAAAQRIAATALIRSRKACIIVPSRDEATDNWGGLPIYSKTNGEAGLAAFRSAAPPSKLVLAGRFDGIDLPGDSCRVLVLDGLPRGAALLDRFLAESVRSRELRASGTAIRFVQAIGRIFRSNTDHGVVLLCGDDLQSWLMDQYNQGFLPPLLQQQVRLGLDLRADVLDGRMTFDELVRGVLEANPDWDALYNNNLAEYTTTTSSFDKDVSAAFLLEHDAAKALWNGDFAEASQRYQEAATRVAEKEPALAGWFSHIAGLAALREGDDDLAATLFYQAAAARSEFGRPSWKARDGIIGGQPGNQAVLIAERLKQPQKYINGIDQVLDWLSYDKPTTQVEEALAELGRLLGLEAARPDKKKGNKTGPDVTWEAPWRNQGASFELKTGKKSDGKYSKDDIGQCHDHDQWLLTNRVGVTFSTFIVGRHLGVVPEANPDPELRVVELDGLIRIAQQLQQTAIAAIKAPEGQRAAVVHAFFKADGMLWPTVIDAIESRYVLDLQSNPPTPGAAD